MSERLPITVTEAIRSRSARFAWMLASAYDPATRAWMILTGGSALRLGLGFVASVIIARTFGPKDLGVYATVAAVATTVGAFADFGLTESAVRRVAFNWPGRQDAAGDSAASYVRLRLVLTTVVVLLGLTLIPISPVRQLLPVSPVLLSLALLGVIATCLGGSTNGLLQATGKFGQLSAIIVLNSALTVVLAVLLRLAGTLTVSTAIVVLGIGTSLVSAGIGWKLIAGELAMGRLSWRVFRVESGLLLGFGRWLWVANTCAMLAAQLDLLLAGHTLQPVTVGAYALAVGLASKANVVNQSLHAALLPFASSLRTRSAITSYLRRGLMRSALIAAGLLIMLPLAGPVIPSVFGAGYRQSVGIFQALLGVAIVDVLAAPVLLLAYTADRPRVIATADALRVVVLVVVAVALIPTAGAFGLVIARLAASVSGLVITVLLLARQIRSGGSPIESSAAGDPIAIEVD